MAAGVVPDNVAAEAVNVMAGSSGNVGSVGAGGFLAVAGNGAGSIIPSGEPSM